MLLNYGKILSSKHLHPTVSRRVQAPAHCDNSINTHVDIIDTGLDESNVTIADFTSEQDSKIYNAVRAHCITSDSRRINWNEIKRITNTFHTPNQIKWRYKIISNKKNKEARISYLSQNFSLHQKDKNTCFTQPVTNHAKVSNLSQHEKIIRIAAALQSTSQRDFYNKVFFENLPETIGVKEEWYWLRRFYYKHYEEITERVDNANKKRLCIDDNSTMELRCLLLNMYCRQRNERKDLLQSNRSRKSIVEGLSEPLKNGSKATSLDTIFSIRPNYDQLNSEKIWQLPEWKEALVILSSIHVFPYISLPRFWYAMRNRLKTTTTKTEFDFEKEFYTKIVPARNVCGSYKLPSFNLSAETNEAIIMIFHEVNKFGFIKWCIEQLLRDGMLCAKTSLQDWIHKFALEIGHHDEKFFFASQEDLIGVQEIVKEFIMIGDI